MIDNVTQLRAHAKIPPRDQRDWVTSAELVADSGVTYRRINYWTGAGLLTPLEAAHPGPGSIRRYHEGQVARAMVLRDLFDLGLAGPVVRQIVDDVVAQGHATLGAITIVRPTSGDAA